MNHQDAQSVLAVLALGELRDPERAAGLAHVAQCADCRRDLAELKATVTVLQDAVAALPDAALSAGQLAAVLAPEEQLSAEPAPAAVPAEPGVSGAPGPVTGPSFQGEIQTANPGPPEGGTTNGETHGLVVPRSRGGARATGSGSPETPKIAAAGKPGRVSLPRLRFPRWHPHLPRLTRRDWLQIAAVIAMVAVVAGLSLPSLSQARGKARRINAAGNMRQTSLALRMKSADKGELQTPAPDRSVVDSLDKGDTNGITSSTSRTVAAKGAPASTAFGNVLLGDGRVTGFAGAGWVSRDANGDRSSTGAPGAPGRSNLL